VRDGSCYSSTRHLGDEVWPPAGQTVESPDQSEVIVSEILLTVLAEAIGAVLLTLITAAIRRAMGAARA
jgi:hypothetical protein